ncbi:SHOCT domain-containing protein [Candidatus Pseudothioglobus singularis]|nr:SHOCT domain-containing protein [Candidatus Pseudothioglobus singularis]
MKKLLILLISLGVLTSSHADFFDGWTDDNLCGWMQNPSPPANIAEETKKRGLTCVAGKATNASSINNKTLNNDDLKDSSSVPTKVISALGYPDGELREPKSYSIFSSQATYFKKLVNNGMYLSAQRLFVKHRYNYFTKKSGWGEVPYDNLKNEFLEAANGVLATFEPDVQSNLESLQDANSEIMKTRSIPESIWSEYKKLLDDNSKLYEKYKSNKLVEFVIRKEKKFNPPLKNKVYKEGQALEFFLRDFAGIIFANYDLINNDNFFNLYPIRLTAKDKVKIINNSVDHIAIQLGKTDKERAAEIIEQYQLKTLKTDFRLVLIAGELRNFKIFNESNPYKLNNFFSDYDLTDTDKKKIINGTSDYFVAQLTKASMIQATSIIKDYGLDSPDISFSNKLSGILLEKSIGSKENPTIIDVIETLNSLSAIDTNGKNDLPDEYQIAVLKITSDNEKEPKIKPSNILKAPIKDFSKAAKSPYIITVQSRILSIDKSDEEIKKVQSKYKSSSVMVQNSQYTRYQNEYQRAKDDFDRWNQDMNTLKQWRRDAESQYRADQAESRAQQQMYNNNNASFNCTSNSYGYNTQTNCQQTNSYNTGWGAMTNAMSGIGGNIGRSFAQVLNNSGYNDAFNKGTTAINSARQRMSNARSKLNNTESQITKDTFKNYSFTTRKFDVIKNIERVVFLINNNLNTYSVFTIPHQEKKAFIFTSGLDINDKTHKLTDYQDEDDIEIFTNNGDSFSIEELIAKIPREHPTKKLEGPIDQVLGAIQFAFNEVTKKSSGQQKQTQESSTTNQSDSNNSDDYIEKIKQAKSLLDAGIISQEEFDKIKQKIIDSI